MECQSIKNVCRKSGRYGGNAQTDKKPFEGFIGLHLERTEKKERKKVRKREREMML